MDHEIAPRRLRSRFKKALIIEHPDVLLDSELRKIGIEPHRLEHVPEEDELVSVLEAGQHDLIFKRSRVLITERVVQASRHLAAVMLCSIGDDSVDKLACARNGVLVTNDPVSNGRSVAELVIGEIISASRRVIESVNQMASSTWVKSNAARFEVQGKKLGILGLGKIGRQVAQLAQALGMEVLFHDCDEIAVEVGNTLGYAAVAEPEELFRRADIVTVHISATDSYGRSNDGFITYEMLAALGDKSHLSPKLFLNLARGFLHTTEALRRAVEEGRINYAFVDVFPSEPHQSKDPSWDYPYAGLDRVMATPHIGAATLEAQPRIARYVARTTQMLDAYGGLRNCVFMPKATIAVTPTETKCYLAVVHSDTRGTKKAVDDAIFQAGANNLQSAHIDFPQYHIAYDLSALDSALTPEQIDELIAAAVRLTGDSQAIRAIRMIS